MRLINTSTLTLEMFFGEAVPDYAILSHRWNDVEVSFQDLQNGEGEQMAAYSKIQRCCAQAQLDGWQYAWIDSCCIDKTSSAELSEAINSMYSWYKESQVCYAYLADIRRGETLQDDLRGSNWFTRGWTLQELLAPSSVVFFDTNWNDVGTKGSLVDIISEITGIGDFVNFEGACVAQKMSWMAKRETTRVEDGAYCLLGLFNVNMPPLYGEGEKSFMRLQLEILKTSDDESIFAW
ncbi:heterokaryon incompatibility protein-domain-containing protein, partial [Hyaloscypha finlandica]